MNHTMTVRVPKGIGDHFPDLADAVERRSLTPLHGVGKGLAIDIFHDQKRHPFMLAYVEDRHNSGVRQSTRSSRLAIKSLAEFGALFASQYPRKDGIDGYDTIHGGVTRSENTSHRTVAKLIDDLISPNILWNADNWIRLTLAHGWTASEHLSSWRRSSEMGGLEAAHGSHRRAALTGVCEARKPRQRRANAP